MATNRLNLTRDQLSKISSDHRVIRQLEALVGVGESVESGELEEEILEAGKTFETVNQNNSAYPKSFTYASGVLTSITYTKPDLTTIKKTFGYTAGKLTTVTLSGSTPADIDLTKTLIYSGDTLASVSYSQELS